MLYTFYYCYSAKINFVKLFGYFEALSFIRDNFVLLNFYFVFIFMITYFNNMSRSL